MLEQGSPDLGDCRIVEAGCDVDAANFWRLPPLSTSSTPESECWIKPASC
jgi:hypothetical protein